MTSLICGSLAFDTIMAFHGRFSDALLADQLHKINVSFLVPDMRREYGGCAGNIGYNLKLLGGDPQIMATVGLDGERYLQRLQTLGISTRHVTVVEDSYTAQCFITTDAASNQFAAFHPGAMSFSHRNRIADAKGVKLAIVAPDGRQAMVEHARDCAELSVPFVFDPGQGLPMFDGAELRSFIQLATWVAVNDYEGDMLVERTGLSFEQIAAQVQALVVTRGENGAYIYTGGRRIEIPCVPVPQVVDPTGCGDAFRAGMLYGLSHDMDWETTGRLASLMGSIKIAHQGGQNHVPTKAQIEDRFKEAFGYRYA